MPIISQVVHTNTQMHNIKICIKSLVKLVVKCVLLYNVIIELAKYRLKYKFSCYCYTVPLNNFYFSVRTKQICGTIIYLMCILLSSRKRTNIVDTQVLKWLQVYDGVQCMKIPHLWIFTCLLAQVLPYLHDIK